MKFIITLITIFLSLATSAFAATKNTINIDPEHFAPVCGLIYQVNVNVKSRAKQQDVSFNCGYLLTYIEIDTKSKDVDLVYLCDTNPQPLSNIDYVRSPILLSTGLV